MRRHVVLHPRTASARRVDRVTSTRSRVRGFAVDTNDVLAYARAQRRLALQVFVPVVAGLLAVLVVTALSDALDDRSIGRIPALWLLLGPVVLFGIVGLAVWHERRALRLEDEWTERHR